MSGVSLRANETLEATLDAYGNMILRLAYSCLKSRDDAEDVLQDVMVRKRRTRKSLAYPGDDQPLP